MWQCCDIKHQTLSEEDAALGTTIGVGVVASAPWVAGFTSAGVTAGSAAAGMELCFDSLRSRCCLLPP